MKEKQNKNTSDHALAAKPAEPWLFQPVFKVAKVICLLSINSHAIEPHKPFVHTERK